MNYKGYRDIPNISFGGFDTHHNLLLSMLQDLAKEVMKLEKDMKAAEPETKFSGQINGQPIGQPKKKDFLLTKEELSQVAKDVDSTVDLQKEEDLQEAIRLDIKALSIENRSNTPDFILAKFLCEVLSVAENLVKTREQFFRDLNHE